MDIDDLKPTSRLVPVIRELKLCIVVLGFFKIMFFIRIFEEYGFFVQMIKLCLADLTPFMVCYFAFMYMFVICFSILDMEIDDEVAGAKGLSYEEYVFLQVYRTSIGELAMPGYKNITAEIKNDGENFFASFNITLLWWTWYAQTFTMIIILLNFLIAVITSTYERVIKTQNQIRYKHKADLNEEYYILRNSIY